MLGPNFHQSEKSLNHDACRQEPKLELRQPTCNQGSGQTEKN